jgi:hypothetical protein
MSLPFIIYREKRLWGHYTGTAFFLWAIVSTGERTKKNIEKTARHETIHFWQQAELGFVLSWLVWAILMLRSWILHGKKAYINHPWEREAYDVDDNPNCVKERKFLAWIKYL